MATAEWRVASLIPAQFYLRSWTQCTLDFRLKNFALFIPQFRRFGFTRRWTYFSNHANKRFEMGSCGITHLGLVCVSSCTQGPDRHAHKRRPNRRQNASHSPRTPYSPQRRGEFRMNKHRRIFPNPYYCSSSFASRYKSQQASTTKEVVISLSLFTHM